MTRIAIDQMVPEFTAIITGHHAVSLKDFRGKNVVLYFYPKDNTPGCTLEGQQFRDRYPEFSALNTEILGISRDTLAAHENFRNKHNFPFHLIADQDEALCQLFDVIKLKKMYGRESRGIERSTFLIDQEGVLRQQWRKVRVDGHADAVLAAVQRLVDFNQ